MELDWGDGDYARTARQLEVAAHRALDLAEVSSGERVLDLGCGNGNVTLAAARLGAVVTAMDPSARLLETARARAEAMGMTAHFVVGEGARIDVPDDSFDAVIAVFSVIFAPDPAACVQEMMRVVRPGGRLVITSWLAEGAINDIAELLRPADAPRPETPWPFEDKIRELFSHYAANVSITKDSLPFEGPSAKAWFDEMEVNHPAWRLMKTVRAADWEEIRTRSIEILRRANEVQKGFRCTSGYLLTRVDTD